jgi:hypothetical protein
MPDKPKCKNCKHYDKIDNEKGECHKIPPVMPNNTFPIVAKNNWCSEYEEEQE